MANIKSAKKRILVAEKKRVRNQAHRSALRTAVKKANVAIENNADNKAEAVNEAIRTIDKAAGRGIIHKKKAARAKSQLATHLNG